MRKNPLAEKGWLTAVSLSLLCLSHARGQTVDGTQIIGYNDSSSVYNIENLDSSDFTTFIVGFIMPGGTPTAPDLTFDSAEDSTYANELSASFVQGINTTETAGKNVLLSFGGADATDAAYAAFGDNATDTATLAGILTAYVNGASTYTDGSGVSHPITTYAGSTPFRGFSGIDLDYEDSGSFSSGNTFSGVTFLQNLTNDLRTDLGSKIITQAPQTPYLTTTYAQNNNGAYQAVLTGAPNPAGAATTWLNVQFYSNPAYDGNSDPDGVVAAFKTLVQDNPGIPTSKLVLTLPMYNIGSDNTFTNAQIQYIITQINTYLKGLGDGTIAGVAGFQLYNPAYGNDTQVNATPSGLDSYNEAFAYSIAQVDMVPEPSSDALFGLGGLGLAWLVRRRKAAAR